MRLVELAKKDVLLILRDRKALMLIIVMPFILTAILGGALGGMFREPASAIGGAFSLMVANQDRGEVGGYLVKAFQADDLKALLTPKPVATRDEALAAVDKKEARVALVIPADFSERVLKGEPAAIEVYQHPESPLRGSIVEAIATAFTDHLSAVGTATTTGVNIWVKSGVVRPQDLAQAAAALAGQLQAVGEQAGLQQVRYQPVEPRKGVTAFQYYAAAMAVMFCLFATTSSGSRSFLTEREDGTLPRLLTTPTPGWQIVAGKLVGTFLNAVLEMVTLIVATTLIFRVSWGHSPLGLAVMVLAVSLGASGVAIFIASISRNSKIADLISMLFIQLSALIGGSMVPLSTLPEGARKVSLFTFNGIANNAFVSIMEGRPLSVIVAPALILAVAGLALALIGSRRLTA
ncbi:MAG TPA: ABC transporter permease [Bacillota bacterium]|jgi:ABC-2 type transport system permease protein